MATIKEQSNLDVLTNALVNATNLQRVLDAPRNSKINSLTTQYGILEEALNEAQTSEDINVLSNKADSLNRENIYSEISLLKDTTNMKFRDKKEEHQRWSNTMSNMSKIVNQENFTDTEEEWRGDITNWQEIYASENPDEENPLMQSLMMKYTEYGEAMSNILTVNAQGQPQLLHPNFKYNKSGKGFADEEIIKKYMQYGRSLERYLGFAFQSGTINERQWAAGVSDLAFQNYEAISGDVVKKADAEIRDLYKRIKNLTTWWNKKDAEWTPFARQEFTDTEEGGMLGLTGEDSPQSIKEKIVKQINEYRTYIDQANQQKIDWVGKTIGGYESPSLNKELIDNTSQPFNIIQGTGEDVVSAGDIAAEQTNQQKFDLDNDGVISDQEATAAEAYTEENIQKLEETPIDKNNWIQKSVLGLEEEPAVGAAKAIAASRFGWLDYLIPTQELSKNPENAFKIGGQKFVDASEKLIKDKVNLFSTTYGENYKGTAINPEFAKKVKELSFVVDENGRTVKHKGGNQVWLKGAGELSDKWKKLGYKVVKVDLSDISKLSKYDNYLLNQAKGLSLYTGIKPSMFKKLANSNITRGIGGFVAYNVATITAGEVVENLTDDEVKGQFAAKGTGALINAGVLVNMSSKARKSYQKAVNKTLKSTLDDFIKKGLGTKGNQKAFRNIAEKVGKEKTAKFAEAMIKKLMTQKVAGKVGKKLAMKATLGVLGKLGLSMTGYGTVISALWLAYDIYDLGYMAYEILNEVNEELAQEELNKLQAAG